MEGVERREREREKERDEERESTESTRQDKDGK